MADNYLSFNYNNPNFITKIENFSNKLSDFGGFIINEGNDLKFFNPSNFSHEFMTPQFGKQSYFLGTTRENREFNFPILLQGITLDTYREFLRWLNPEEEGILSFDYSPNYGYDVKVNSISEATFYVTPNCSDINNPTYNIELEIGFITKNDWAAKNLNENNLDFKFLPIQDSGDPNSTDPLIYYESILNTKEIFRIDYITDEFGHYKYHTLSNNLNVDNFFELKLTSDISSIVLIRDENSNNILYLEVSDGTSIWYSKYGIVLDENGNFQKTVLYQEKAIINIPANSSINIKIIPEFDDKLLKIRPTLREII